MLALGVADALLRALSGKDEVLRARGPAAVLRPTVPAVAVVVEGGTLLALGERVKLFAFTVLSPLKV